nr:P1 family peptidase [Tautonia marina]
MMVNLAMGWLVMVLSVMMMGSTDEPRPRARDLGLRPGVFPTGPQNAITDVSGVLVGQVTLVEGDDVRTGVTAVLPHGGNLFAEKVPGAVFVGNAFGKLAGSTQVEELGTIETPIVLTNTLSVGTAIEAVVRETLRHPDNATIRSVNAVVGETNDGGLNDIRTGHITAEHVQRALRDATDGPVSEGSVGAGTGCECFGWKGGIGTSSRVLPERFGGWRIGVLVQANYGGVLTIGGAPVGRRLGRHPFQEPDEAGNAGESGSSADGSCMIIVATDAPIAARDLKRLAARAVFGLARTGSSYSHGSGDYAIAFSTAPTLRVRPGDQQPQIRSVLPSESVSPLFQAALEATEEAVYNALLQASTTTGRNGRTVEAIPIEPLRTLLREHRLIDDPRDSP